MSEEFKGRALVYSIVGCPHCIGAKSTLADQKIPYIEVSLTTYPHLVPEVKKRTGKTSVPQIYFNNVYVGGNAELQKALQDKGEWRRLLKEVTDNAPQADAPTPPDPSTAKKEDDTESTGSGVICEPDEYGRLVQELRRSGIIKDHRKGLSTVKNSFTGKEFTDWVVKHKGLDRETALQMGQGLIDRHFGHNVKDQEKFADDGTLYRLLEDDESSALNAGQAPDCAPRPAGDLGEALRLLILKIYAKFLSSDGKKVDYKGIAKSDEFKHYKQLSLELQRVQLEGATREEKLAFFINVYNAMVVHANVAVGPPVNLWQRYKFFNTVRYIIGGYQYSMQDIENGVLRANRKGVGMLSKPFGKSDPRLKVALAEPEPFVHFALVCGAKSCPPIKTYSTKGVMSELEMACEAFLEGDDGAQIDMAKREIRLSKIFDWYKVDFGGNNNKLVEWLLAHMPNSNPKKAQMEELYRSKHKVKFMTYDWSVNSK